MNIRPSCIFRSSGIRRMEVACRIGIRLRVGLLVIRDVCRCGRYAASSPGKSLPTRTNVSKGMLRAVLPSIMLCGGPDPAD